MGDELLCGKAQNGVDFDFEVKFDLEDPRLITPYNYTGLNQGILHFWSKYGDSSLNGWQVILRTSSCLPHMDTHTDRRRQPQYPKAKTGFA